MAKWTITPLVVGMNQTDQGVMTYLNNYGEKIRLPIYVFAVTDGERKLLIDTGLEQVMPNPEAEQETGLKILSFEQALESVGWSAEEIDGIIHTHLHNDHCENDYKCPKAKLYVQEKELAFMKDPHPLDHRMFPDILDDNEHIETLNGDTELFEGLKLIFTPGHTPGGQSVMLDTEEGSVLITGFCCNAKNFPQGRPAIIPGVHLDVREAYDSLHKVLDLQADILAPLHDPEVGRRGRIG